MRRKSNQHHEKYDSKNPIAQKMLNGFMSSIEQLINQIPVKIESVTECGCGQGHVNRQLEKLLPEASIQGFDIAENDIEIAQSMQLMSATKLYQKNIYNIGPAEQADLIVCCEVLEHLEQPELALSRMAELGGKYYLFSVPNEPIWRILNFLRGKYISDWGNTPDHRNHWSTKKFKNFVSEELDIIAVNTPLPWSMVLATSKKS